MALSYGYDPVNKWLVQTINIIMKLFNLYDFDGIRFLPPN